MSNLRDDLIYDVGLFDGADTAYYLFRGYKVVAIEANPLMIERAKLRFSREILSQKLVLLNIGVAKTAGTAIFWVSDVPEWSSFDRTIASRDGTAHTPVSVPTLSFSQVLAEHGIPHYLKIDIEGNDRLCVDALVGGQLPKYISVEAECVGDSKAVSDDEATAMLEALRDIGYRYFKLVNQRTWYSVRPNQVADLLMRVINSAAYGRLQAKGLSRIAKTFTNSARISNLDFTFAPGSSGPWGDDIPGSWMTFEKAKLVYLRTRHSYFRRNGLLYLFWYDWHATY